MDGEYMDKVTIPLIAIEAELYTFDDIDNSKLAIEMESNQQRATYDPVHVAFEDRFIQYDTGSECEKLLDKIRTIGHDLGLELVHYHLLVHEPLESTNTHHHINHRINTVLSWVYYVDVPVDAGKIVFMNDQYDIGPNYVHEPVNGTLLMFPSFVLHKVTKNMSGKKRISIAGDFAKFN